MASKKSNTAAPARRNSKASETAPAAAAGNPDGTVAAVTQPATTKENPASTTSAPDPKRESNAPTNTTAEINAGLADNEGAPAPGETEQAKGEFHSHPAETAAERSLRMAGASGSPMEFPAGEFADPERNQSPTESDLQDTGSIHDESGKIQDATRAAIGAGYGAPDGVGGDAVDGAPGSEEQPDDIEPVELPNGITFRGNKAKLWRMIEAGATHDEMRKETGYASATGTIYVMADQASREIEVSKAEDGTRTYKLKADEA